MKIEFISQDPFQPIVMETFNRRNFFRVGVPVLTSAALIAACVGQANGDGDTEIQPTDLPFTPQAYEPSPTLGVELPLPTSMSSEEVGAYLAQCGPECEGVKQEDVASFDFGSEDFIFFKGVDGINRGRMRNSAGEWLDIFGDISDDGSIAAWELSVTGVTPVAPGVGTVGSETVLWFELKNPNAGGNIIIGHYVPKFGSESVFQIPLDSGPGKVNFASPVKFEPRPETPQGLSPDQIAAMSDNDKLAASPDFVNGIPERSISTVNPNLVLYSIDGNTPAQFVYDLSVGKVKTPEEAGVIEIPFVDGNGVFEMLSFGKDIEAASKYISENSQWLTGDRTGALNSWFVASNPKAVEFSKTTKRLQNRSGIGTLTLPSQGNQFVLIKIDRLGNGTMVYINNINGDFEAIYLDVPINSTDTNPFNLQSPQQ